MERKRIALYALVTCLPYLLLTLVWNAQTGLPTGPDNLVHLGRWQGWSFEQVQSSSFWNHFGDAQSYEEYMEVGSSIWFSLFGWFLPAHVAVSVSMLVLVFCIIPFLVYEYSKSSLAVMLFIAGSNAALFAFTGGGVPRLLAMVCLLLFLIWRNSSKRYYVVVGSFLVHGWAGPFLLLLLLVQWLGNHASALAVFFNPFSRFGSVVSPGNIASGFQAIFSAFPLLLVSFFGIGKAESEGLEVWTLLLLLVGGLVLGVAVVNIAVPLLAVSAARVFEKWPRTLIYVRGFCLVYFFTNLVLGVSFYRSYLSTYLF